MTETAAEIEGGAILFPEIGENSTNQPIIRYLESAWEFLLRLASHNGTMLVPDINTTGAPQIFARLPQVQESPVEWQDSEVRIIRQDGRYLELTRNG